MQDIQFTPLPVDPPKPPPEPPFWLEWLDDFFRWLGELLRPIGRLLGANWNGIEILLVLLAAMAAIWIAWSVLWPLWRDRSGKSVPDPREEWSPARDAALALLEDADRLAAEGRFGEAAHLLLQRSVLHIAAARPDWLSPSSTSREIGQIEGLPMRARHAFAVIAAEVERSLFAMRGLAASDWERARAAYAEFALADLGHRR